MSATVTLVWDEPAGCTTPRGWLKADGVCTGFYLDYGPDNYRFGHRTEIHPGKIVSFCQRDGRLCRECEPGGILAVRYPGGPSRDGEPRSSRYVGTVAQARAWIETGTI